MMNQIFMASLTPAELWGLTAALVLKEQVLDITRTAILYKWCLKRLLRLKSPACYKLQWLFFYTYQILCSYKHNT